tara:strand:- start:260 stop:631 length:372 start_codon:yes stop_codon:yes gene_type:complete
MTQERDTVTLLKHATMYVGIKKITKKNYKLFNKRLKILRFAGLHIFDTVKFSDIEDNLGLVTDVKPMTPKEFKNIVWQSMEDGAEILIKEEQESPVDTSPPVPESLEGQESQDQQDVKAQGKS